MEPSAGSVGIMRQPLGSIGTPASRWLTIDTSATTSAPASGSSSWPKAVPKHTLVPAASNSTGAPSASASGALTIGGSGSMSTNTASAASTACARVSATTAATTSPTKRTVSPANTGRLKVSGTRGKLWNDSRPRLLPAWYTARTPGIDSAPLTSTDRTVPYATIDRTNTMCVAPSHSRSSTYLPAPVRRAGSSRRWTGLPRIEPAARAIVCCSSSSHAHAARSRP
jgi:hypothetical protein